MKYSYKYEMFSKVLKGLIKENYTKDELTRISKEYKEIMIRAKDIGSSNNLIVSYLLAAYFIAMNRMTTKTPEENYEILKSGLSKSKLLKLGLGDSKSYLAEKKMEFRRNWAKESKNKKYENDWVEDFIEKDDKYEFGIDYLECGVCKLCKDENCFELAKYMCKLDFMLAELIGLKLTRTKTLAEGFDKCDFRYSKK